uniref:Uncharacterized protein n=1 Tax=Arundo donax TaxID=35708 RepID=A0A0A9BCQ1_ARUDO
MQNNVVFCCHFLQINYLSLFHTAIICQFSLF